MAMLLPNISFNYDDKFPVSRRHIDAKGFLFKTTEDPSRRKVMLKGYLERQKATQNGPDQASICDELGWDCVVLLTST